MCETYFDGCALEVILQIVFYSLFLWAYHLRAPIRRKLRWQLYLKLIFRIHPIVAFVRRHEWYQYLTSC